MKKRTLLDYFGGNNNKLEEDDNRLNVIKETPSSSKLKVAQKQQEEDNHSLENQEPKSDRKENSKQSGKKNQHQLFLDFGQRSISHYTCKVCNMTFQRGVVSDEDLHRTYHKKKMTAKIIYSPSSNPPSINDYLDGGSGFVTHISLSACKSEGERKRILKILCQVNQVMEATRDDSARVTNIWLYIEKKNQVMGLLAIEPVNEKMVIRLGGRIEDENGWKQRKFLVGVNRIWIHAGRRGRGLAQLLLDRMRISYIFGFQVSVNQIAFSQPTEAGKALACKYLGLKDSLDIPIYIIT